MSGFSRLCLWHTLPPRGDFCLIHHLQTDLYFVLPLFFRPPVLVSAATSPWWGSSSRCITLRGEAEESWERGGWSTTPTQTHWWGTHSFRSGSVQKSKMFCSGYDICEAESHFHRLLTRSCLYSEETPLLDLGLEEHDSVPEWKHHEVLQGMIVAWYKTETDKAASCVLHAHSHSYQRPLSLTCMQKCSCSVPVMFLPLCHCVNSANIHRGSSCSEQCLL